MNPSVQHISSGSYSLPPSPEANSIINLVFAISMRVLYYSLYKYTHKQHIILFCVLWYHNVLFHKFYSFIHSALWIVRSIHVDVHSSN